ncbi:hypothetical protein ACEQPO_27265 [Bacillus sp. SL00103]
MITAARQAGIEKRIHQMEERYDALTWTFEEGRELSGGQWQKACDGEDLFLESDFIILDGTDFCSIHYQRFSLIRKLSIIPGSRGLITHRMGAPA